jgi:hypothetical protein
MDLVNIAKAWIIAKNPNEEQKAKAESRIAICNECEHAEEKLGVSYCSICLCPLNKKIFSPKGAEECPASKWTI